MLLTKKTLSTNKDKVSLFVIEINNRNKQV